MSFLYPLFLAGITAISLPIILHMIRRHTRKRVTFSSLMFLRTTVPRFRSRSRLENLPLLILRCLILCLLAFAFSRPFFLRATEGDQITFGKRTLLLIDTSASMQRAGLWTQAVNEARTILENAESADRVCVISFDENAKTLIGFESWSEMSPGRRVQVAIEEISELSPAWASTNLGNALVAAAESIEDDQINDRQQISGKSQVVLISDLQQGGNLDALHTYEWPKNIELAVKLIKAKGNTNAAMLLVTSHDFLSQTDNENQLRIRITNSADAVVEQFKLNMVNIGSAETSGKSIDVYVPPGHSIVTNVPSGPKSVTGQKILLTGDDHNFDNTLYLAPNPDQQVNILYIGSDDEKDPRQMLYYIQRAFQPTGTLKPNLVSKRADNTLTDTDIISADLIIVTEPLGREHIKSVRREIESGKNVFLVMKSADAASTIAAITGFDNLQAEEAQVDEYAMLGSIEFEHPLLSLFAEPQFGDFTKIHFWKYRQIDIEDLPGARSLARFDNNDPGLFEIPLGKGSLLVLTSGWQPTDSQLALSSKFVPILYSILEYNGVFDGGKTQYFVNDNIRIPQQAASAQTNLKIRKPDNSLIDLAPEQQLFTGTQLPGIYSVESPSGDHLFAVNLLAKESRTAPMSLDDFEQSGIPLQSSSGVTLEQTRQAGGHSSVIEMESEQKLWRWLLTALLVVLIAETWLAGWLTRPAILTQGEEK